MSIVTLLVLALCGGLCAWLSLRHAMHMFQLNSYQDLSYGNYLRAHRGAFWNAKRLVPCAVMLLGSLSVTALPLLFAAGTGLFVLLNRPQKAKKPLVFTPRVRRMLVCAAALFVLWVLLADYVSTCFLVSGALRMSRLILHLGLFVPALMLVLAILLQHRLVMLYNDLLSPAAADLARFCDSVTEEPCTVKIFDGRDGPDYKIL